MRAFSFLFFFLLSLAAHAQQRDAAIAIVDTLTSPYMNGRGYVDDGDGKAAAYIRNAFSASGLKSFGKSYEQEFTFNVNTFPGKMELKIDDVTLVVGKDFILDAYSGPIKGKFRLLLIDSTFVQSEQKLKRFYADNNKDVLLVADKKSFGAKNFELLTAYMKEANALNTAGLIEITDGKLTMSVSTEQLPFTHFIIKQSAFPSAAKTATASVDAVFEKSYQSQNVIGYITGEKTDSFFVFSAHYDHLGQLGEGVYFPGANDNASGTAMLIQLATWFSKPENKPEYTMVFIAFSGEEAGLLGSAYYVEHPLFDMKKIKFLVNMDILGTGDEGIKVVNGAVLTEPFNRLTEINNQQQYLKSVQPRGAAANSDHYFFSEKGVPAFFIYTLGGIDAYHDIYDKAETLPLTEFEDLFHLLVDFQKSF